ncbi:prolyl oligopeptidase family serine peptidase [Mangrovibacterium diazotrophicum]|uniref:prolyl oligopeptidase n=1 Tax=Mangrovibacterium diazotrophicum TaxID=1261403 RepID=A0A419VXC3_9BACT|nr:prolyl oligopeptidase family serine peptidase [Mangrovibacterium diazotrophicum]RKD87868.1 oligopeptidase B [Mangrovibacterium diazotrophicum]
MKRRLLFPCLPLVSLMFFQISQAFGQIPPVAKIDNVEDEYWGVKVEDPYRYMENLDAPEVQAWIKGQADYAASILDTLPGREQLRERLHELYSGKPYSSGGYRMLENGKLFFLKRISGESLLKLYLRDGQGEDKLLVDPSLLSTSEGDHYSIADYTPSPDGNYLVYGLAKSGSEETVYHILDVSTGKALPETIDRIETAYNRPFWLPDDSGFFYSRRQLLAADAPETEIYKKTKVYFHQLNTDANSDQVIAGYELSDKMELSDVDFPSIYLAPNSDYAVVKIKHGDSNELTLYTAPVNTLLKSDIPWAKICDVEDEVTDYAVHLDDIYLQSAHKSPRFKIISTSLKNPDIATAEVIVPESKSVISTLASSFAALFVEVTDAGTDKLLQINYSAPDKVETIQIEDKALNLVGISPATNKILVRTSSWVQGPSVFSYDPTSRAYEKTDLIPPGKYDSSDDYVAEEVMAKSWDGTLVPLSILHKKGIKLNGKNPTLLEGYGSYGMVYNSFYSPGIIAWLEQGGVWAWAHIRGGGEYGKDWHMAGRMLNKPNTWKDFIACGEYLVEHGYTSSKMLAGQGGSAGGITIGRSITDRPDLFKAAIINVGLSDAIRMETTTNGIPNIQEFGTVKDEDGFKGLLAMSAYHHVKDGVEYPAVLITHGINDPRVTPWNSAKMTARLQAATSSNNPILFRVDYKAGHGIGSTLDQYIDQLADEYSFLLWQFGVDPTK